MKRLAELKERYKKEVIFPEKNIRDVIDYIVNKVDVIPVEANFMGDAFFSILENNAYSCCLNERSRVDKSDFIFEQYVVIRNEKSRIYYEEKETEEIYLIFELRTGYMESNCNKLFLELYLQKGIDKTDFDADNILCQTYVSFLEEYFKDPK